MERIQKQKNHERYATDEELVEAVGKVAVDNSEDLLDEIDRLIAETPVDYVQKPGE